MFVTPFLWSTRTLAKRRFLMINCQSRFILQTQTFGMYLQDEALRHGDCIS
jgi:hypothetical protein